MSWREFDRKDDRDRLDRQLARLRKLGQAMEPVEAPGGSRALVKSFWARAWCHLLEEWATHEYRLPRGRAYLRQGRVYDLFIEPGVITAQVAGSSMYEVRITLKPLPRGHWEELKAECAGQVVDLLALLGGKLSGGVLQTLTDPETGLLAQPLLKKGVCSCPDSADLCKHIAATLYAVGVKLETAPELFFTLRSVDPAELLAPMQQTPLGGQDEALAGEDLSALFGIDLAEPPPPEK